MKKDHLSDTERRVLAVIQEGFPKSQTPYQDMAKKIGLDTKELLALLRTWQQDGKLRRIGAILNHFKIGLNAGAMVLWQVEAERIGQVAEIMAGFKEISHLYERITTENWPYNLYSMIHGKNADDVQQVVEKIKQQCNVSKYRILVTEKELKKVPPVYIKKDE